MKAEGKERDSTTYIKVDLPNHEEGVLLRGTLIIINRHTRPVNDGPTPHNSGADKG